MTGGERAAASLSVVAASVVIDARPILDRVSIEVAPGEVVAVVGPSGSGKTTLLRAVSGLQPLSAGEVRIDGVDQAEVPVHRRNLGVVAQDGALFPHRDVGRNVAFGLRVRGWTKAQIAERTAEVLDLVGLSGFGTRAVQGLSGGERQRVALARALAPSPRLLLLDEPLGALDRALRNRLTDDLAALIGQLGLTVVHVTHDQEEAGALADRIVVLRGGRVAQDGAPTAVHDAPVDAWVARFLGHRNVVALGDLPEPWTVAVAPSTQRGAEVLVPEGAVSIVPAATPTPAPGARRGLVLAVHRPPARPGTCVQIGGLRLWSMAAPRWAEVGGAADVEVDAGSIRVLAPADQSVPHTEEEPQQ